MCWSQRWGAPGTPTGGLRLTTGLTARLPSALQVSKDDRSDIESSSDEETNASCSKKPDASADEKKAATAGDRL